MKTLITVVLDESGSMESCREATISSFNEYINTLKEEKKKISFSLLTFNSMGIKVVCDAIKMKDVPLLTRDNYVPNNLTPLYDAIGMAIKRGEKAVKKEGQDVLIIILTDGLENHSMEYDRMMIYKLIKEKEAEGWLFVYLGANQDAFAVGASIGVSGKQTLSYDTAKIGQTFTAMTVGTRSYLSNAEDSKVKGFFEVS